MSSPRRAVEPKGSAYPRLGDPNLPLTELGLAQGHNAGTLLAAYAFKLLSDFMNLAFAAAERDGHYAAFNIAGLALGVTGCLVAIPHLGIIGAAFAMLLASASLFAARFIAWKRLQSYAPAAREAA